MRAALRAARTLWAALALAAAPAAAGAQGTTSTAPVELITVYNQATVSFHSGGVSDSMTAGASVLLARHAGLTITGPFAASTAPGQRRVFAHLLTNTGTNDDVLTLSAITAFGWPTAIYLDTDGNGQLSAADQRLGTTLLVARHAAVTLLVVIDVPRTATVGTIADIALSATSGNDPRALVSTTDRITVVAKPLPEITLTKSVDLTTATLGDTLHYTIAFANIGDGDATAATLADTLPRGLRLLPGSLQLDGQPLTDAVDTDAGSAETLPDGRMVAHATLGTLASHTSGRFTLAAVIMPQTIAGSLANIALLGYGDSTRTVARSAPTTAVTQVSLATLTLSDNVVGAPIVVVGTLVHLRLSYGNSSTTAARNAVLVDTLSAELSVETAAGASISPAAAAGAPRVPQIVTWTLGTLAPGETGVRDIYARVAVRPAGGSLSDRAAISADNAATQFARVGLLNVALFNANDLRITKTAQVLEVAIGDAVPYTVTVRNIAVVALHSVVVRDRLPDGMRLATRSIAGVDSIVTAGQDVAFFLSAPIPAAGSMVIRYAAVLATPTPGAPLENRVMAMAEDGLVRSDTATAIVRQRGMLALRERNVIGKVWLDRNDDGVQQTGEAGVGGVQVWDANGDVAVTDKEGRFSFRNVSTGTHALRLDPLGIPRNFVLPTRADEVIVLSADGWSLPTVSIRLVPRAGAAQAACGCEAGKGAVVSAGAMPTAARAGGPSSPVTTAPLPVAPVSAGSTSAVAAPLAPAVVVAPMVAPLVSDAERAKASRRELIDGAGTHIVAPLDGTVLPLPRFFTGVRGAPGARVRLYDGATLLREGTLRGDGVGDFLNVELTPGPHHLVAITGDSTSGLHADSIAVHVSGAPDHFVLPTEPPTMRRDASAPLTVRALVLDRWNVPVANHAMITVAPTGAKVSATDEDGSSMGVQISTDASGAVNVPLRAGHEIGGGELRLAAGTARGLIPLRIYASVRPLMVTGVGQLGVGGAPDAYGAVSVQGAVSQNTAVTLTYDSRRASAGNDFFQRGYDPLGDEQFPTVGDHSTSRTAAPTAKAVSARVEHGMDWVAAGDVQTTDFGRNGELGAYRRSLTGVNARLGTGALVWHGFGSMTQQSVERSQLRGDGSSGPYLAGADIRPGTEAVAIEVRARDNAARIVTRQPLTRITDYQIDYTTGAILLRLPVPSTDAYGNPVFVVATVERLTGGAAHFVGGLRLDADAARLLHLGSGLVDSLTIGLSTIHDGVATSAAQLAGTSAGLDMSNADVRIRRGGLALGASILRSTASDSSGTAISANGQWALAGDHLTLDGSWMSVGEGLGRIDPRLASPLSETSVGVTSTLGGASLRLHRDESRFTQYGVTRTTTGLTAEETIGGRKTKQDLSLVSQSGAATGDATALTARITTAVTDRLDTWVDGTRALVTPLDPRGSRPNQVGTGIGLQLPWSLRLEGEHRVMRTPGDSVTYGVTSAQLRANGLLGGQIWTGFEESTAGLHDEVRAGHSALLGWNQKLGLGAGWQLTSLYERRIGLSRASLADPSRALPFVQAEQDRWSASAGLGWVPGSGRARLALTGEMQNAQGVSSSRLQLTGDAALNAGLALIALNDWSGRRDATLNTGGETRQDRSLLGLAMRPVTTNSFNALAKLEWRRTQSPTIGAGGGITAGALGTMGNDVRLIGTTDAVWAPMRGTELSARYALRMTTSEIVGDSSQHLQLTNHFAGARLDHLVVGALHVRADARLLMETQSRTALWNAAPSVLYDLQGHLTLEAGYRFGALRDPDFAAVGGAGAFATVGFRFTEGSLATPAAFWRERIANDR